MSITKLPTISKATVVMYLENKWVSPEQTYIKQPTISHAKIEGALRGLRFGSRESAGEDRAAVDQDVGLWGLAFSF